jgi:hypothetical protein
MIIVSETTGINEIKFIPREGIVFNAILTDEVTGEEVTEALTFTTDGYYTVCSLNTDLVDQRRYNLKIYSSGEGSPLELLYNDILFCSTQDNADYSIANGEFDYSAAPQEYDEGDDTKREFIII